MRKTKEGHNVKIYHQRPGRVVGMPDPKGGKTVVELYDDDGKLLATGIARCSDQDNYNKRLGKTIALGRAMKLLRS